MAKSKKVLGLILELNPPHNGHQYFINMAKKQVRPDFTIGIISTNFTMRGDISIIDKFTKTKLALELGLDLVIELPFLGAVQSADFFAYNSISSLLKLNITDLAFGVEMENINKFYDILKIINLDLYQNSIRNYLQNGLSYSTASLRALQECCTDQEIIENFSKPNNTLAIQYLKCASKLNASLNYTFIKRVDNNYYDEVVTTSIASASSIRTLVNQGQNIDSFIPKFKATYQLANLEKSYQNLFLLLKHRFICDGKEKVKELFNVNEGIESRIESMLNVSNSYDELLSNVQTKRYTKNYLQRLFIHIIMNSNIEKGEYYNYLRVLGMNENGKNYLNKLPKETKKIIITSLKGKTDINSKYELQATKLYGLITGNDNIYLNEYKIPIIGE